MMDGTATSPPNGDDVSQVVTALCAYVIGLELARASLSFGQTFVIWMHRWRNPHFAFSKSSGGSADGSTAAETAHVRKKPLPDYERRDLAYLLPREEKK